MLGVPRRCRCRPRIRPLPRGPRRAAHGLEHALRQLVDVRLSESPGRRMANSSPPSRATVSWRRTGAPAAGPPGGEVVAGGVPEGVVDPLEAVEVDEEQVDGLADPPGPDQLLLDPVLEQPPVGQAGQRVVPGQWATCSSSRAFCRAVAAWSARARSRSWRSGSWTVSVGFLGAEVGRDHPEEFAAREEGGDHRGRRARAGQQVPEDGVFGRGVDDDDLAAVDEVVDHGKAMRTPGGASECVGGLLQPGPGGNRRGPPRPPPLGPAPAPVPTPGRLPPGSVPTPGRARPGGRSDPGRRRPVAGPSSGPGGPAVRCRFPTGRRSPLAPGHGRNGVGQQLHQIGRRRDLRQVLGERKQGPGRRVAATGGVEDPEDVEGGGGVVGIEAQEPELRPGERLDPAVSSSTSRP